MIKNKNHNPYQLCSEGYINNGNIIKFNTFMILLFPFAIFIGPYINIFKINISNIYTLVLCIFIFNNLLKIRYKKISKYIIFFYIMILYALASLIWSKYNDIGLTIILPLMSCFITMVYISAFNENELNLFVNILSLFTIIVLIISMIEIFTGKYIFFNNTDFIHRLNTYNLHYPGVVFANPNDLGQYLIVGFPLISLKLFEENKHIVFSVAIFLITIFILINTLSRLSLISAIIIVAFYLLIYKPNKGNKFSKFFAILCIAIILVFILSYTGISFSKYNIINNFLSINTSQSYFVDRRVIYSSVFNLGLNNILFGTGIGGSYAAASIPPHALFLFIFTDFGIVFAIGFIIVLISTFIFLYKYKDIEICGYRLSKIILPILITFPIFSSISSGNEQRKIVWILLGLVFALIKNIKIRLSSIKQ